MKSKKLDFIILIIIAILLGTLVHFIAKGFNNIKEAEKQKYEHHIGETLIINKDTLTIVNYSILYETFILSNGTSVNYKMVPK